MRNSALFLTLIVFATMEVVVVSAQSALDQLKTYSESGAAANKGAPPAGKGAPPNTPAQASGTGGLPDIIGVRLGMPLRNAFTVVQTAHPKDHLDTDANNIPGIDKPVLAEFRYESKGAGNAPEQLRVDLTPPPNQQVVWKVWRILSQQKIYRANVLSSLREKYGKESVTVPAVAGDQQIGEMWWFLDEQGHPAPPPQGNYAQAIDSLTYCTGQMDRPSWVAAPNLPDHMQDHDPRMEWCSRSGIGVHAIFGYEQIVTMLQVQIFDYPAALRSGKAELNFLNDVGKRQQQQQIDQSKQVKPKL